MQQNFVFSRLGSNPAPEELKDLTDFMHGAPAALLRCDGCGLLTRAEADEDSYEEDPNDPGVMAQVYPRYVRAFRAKRPAYLGLLPPRADVVELGPHLGGFLQAAEEWDWRPVGIDIGADTSAFARSKGLTVIRGTLEDAHVRENSQDAAFIWNCFEQLADPIATLLPIRRTLKRHGLLVVRVPNAAFYQRFRGKASKTLAYNNLLGFPYRYGYSPATLHRLMARAGFEYIQGFNSELLTTPFADLPDTVAVEQQALSDSVARWTGRESIVAMTGPWIEAVYRMSPKPLVEPQARPVSRRFLPRAAA